MILHYMPLVEYFADYFRRTISEECLLEKGDYLTAGILGMMQATEVFDINCGVKLETFAARRIRGAILDVIRKQDWVPRLTRQRERKVDGIREFFYLKYGYFPSDDEVRKVVSLTEKNHDGIMDDSDPPDLNSFGILYVPERSDKGEKLPDIVLKKDDPTADLKKKMFIDLVTKDLSRVHKLVVVLYCCEGLVAREIGQAIGVTESRIIQLKQEALAILRSRFDEKYLLSVL